jgi:hypothetical protein
MLGFNRVYVFGIADATLPAIGPAEPAEPASLARVS